MNSSVFSGFFACLPVKIPAENLGLLHLAETEEFPLPRLHSHHERKSSVRT